VWKICSVRSSFTAHSSWLVFLSVFVSIPLVISESEVEVTAIRAQGPGGQNVNKVSSAIQLRFDIPNSSLSDAVKTRLLGLPDSRITLEGVFVLKAQRYRTQDMNRMDAFSRLHEWVNSVALPPKKRKPTKPSYGSVQKRLQSKNKRSDLKTTRGAKGLD
jgi:ribosome-associated protein